MIKLTYEFEDEREAEEHLQLRRLGDFHAEFDLWMRHHDKYEDNPPELSAIRTKWYELRIKHEIGADWY